MCLSVVGEEQVEEAVVHHTEDLRFKTFGTRETDHFSA